MKGEITMNEKDCSKILRERIKIARDFKKISQRELSRKIGVSANTICSYEKGAFPSAFHLMKIAEALEVTPDFLLGVKNENENKIIKIIELKEEIKEKELMLSNLLND